MAYWAFGSALVRKAAWFGLGKVSPVWAESSKNGQRRLEIPRVIAGTWRFAPSALFRDFVYRREGDDGLLSWLSRSRLGLGRLAPVCQARWYSVLEPVWPRFACVVGEIATQLPSACVG